MGGGIGLSGHAAPSHRHGALPPRHARDRHRPHPRRRRHVAAGACAGRGRHLPGPDRREHERRRRHPRAFRRYARALGQARRTRRTARAIQRAAMSATSSPSTRKKPEPSHLGARRADIDRAFAGDSVEAVLADARRHAGRVGREDRGHAGAEVAQGAQAHAGRHPQCPQPGLARGGAERGVSPDRAPVRGRRVPRRRARAALSTRTASRKWSPPQLDERNAPSWSQRYLAPLPPG